MSLFTFYFAHMYFTVKRFDILQIPGSSVPNSVHLEARSLCSLSALWKGNRRMKSQSAITATDWQIHLLWALSFLTFTVNIIQPCHGNISRWDILCQKCSDANLSLKSTCVKNLWDCVYNVCSKYSNKISSNYRRLSINIALLPAVITKQECIPVGCVPTACWLTGRVPSWHPFHRPPPRPLWTPLHRNPLHGI